MHGETLLLLRLRAAAEEAARALDAIEQGDDINRQRGRRELHEAMARVEPAIAELHAAGNLSSDEARELATVVVELVRMTVRVEREAWKKLECP